MPDLELDPRDDPNSAQFGAGEALFVFNMARNVEEGATPVMLAGRELEALAQDAVMTAIRFRRDAEEPFEDINPAVATHALMTTLVEGLYH